MKKKINIFDVEENWRVAEEFINEAHKRSIATGKPIQEVMAEMDAEEKADEEEEANLPVTHIRLGLDESTTILIADTGTRNVNNVVGEALYGFLPEVIELKKYSCVKELWERLLSSDPEKVWVLDGVESVTDEDIQQCIFYMLKRDEYVPPTLHSELIDFSKRKLILITKAKNEVVAFPPYCRGYSLSTFVVKV